MDDNSRCRLCLQTSGRSVNIFSSDIPSIIEELTSIKVTTNDGLPTTSCETCICDLRTAITIRKRILQSDRMLRNEISSAFAETIVKKERSDEINDEDEDSISDMLNEKDFDYADSDREYEDEDGDLSDVKDEAIEALFRNAREDLELDGIENEVSEQLANERPNKDYNLSDDEPLIKKVKIEEDPIAEKVKPNKERKVNRRNSTKKKESEDKPKETIIIKTETADDDDADNDNVGAGDGMDQGVDDFGSDDNSVGCDLPGASFQLPSNTTAEKDKDYEIVTLAEDILEKTDNPPSVRCKICDITLVKERAQLHKKKHMKAKCKICGIIVRSDNVKKHILAHKYGPQVCDICGSFHKSIEGLRSHLFNFHTKRKNYKCDQCDQEFRLNSKLWDHKRRVHTGLRRHICDECGKAFFQSGTLIRHKNLVHLRLRDYPCEFCQKKFSSPHARKTHMRQHTGELPYVCDICSEGYRQAVSLRTHMKSKHDIIVPTNKPGYTNSNKDYQEKVKMKTEAETS